MAKKLVVSIVVALLFTALSACPSHAISLRIDTPKVQLELAPGQVYTGEIVVENPTDEEIAVKVYLQDWFYKDSGAGEKEFLPVGSLPLSASNWINFSPAETPLKPFSRATVRYTITVPQDVKGGYYSLLFFETLIGTTVDEEGASVNIAARLGASFFIEVKGTVDRKGEIQSLELRAPEGNKPLEIETTFHNTGNVDISLTGNLLIMDSEGKIQGRGSLETIYTFPGGVATRETEWFGRLPKGTHQVVLTYSLGKGQSLVEERALTIA